MDHQPIELTLLGTLGLISLDEESTIRFKTPETESMKVASLNALRGKLLEISVRVIE